MAPAAATVKDLLARKYYRGEFFGFHPKHNMDKVIELLASHHPKHTFRQTEDKIIVEFKNLGDFYNACNCSIHFSTFITSGNF
jgi:hypothetical protein